MVRFTSALAAILCTAVTASPAAASPTLVNPAAAHCIETGGFYGIRDGVNGQVGICMLPDGSETDAWVYLQEASMKETQLANPAAVFCESQGGTHNLSDGTCALPSGSVVDAWNFLRDAHASSAQLANPAAAHCIEKGGTYRIDRGAAGAIGICTQPDGSEIDAWDYFRASQ